MCNKLLPADMQGCDKLPVTHSSLPWPYNTLFVVESVHRMISLLLMYKTYVVILFTG